MKWLLLLPAVCIASGLYTGGWRRVLVRVAWHQIARSVGAANRRDRQTTHKPGPGEKVSKMEAVEHLPILIGVLGRPIGPWRDRTGARWRVMAAVGKTTGELQRLEAAFAATTYCRRAIIVPVSPRTAHLTLLWRDPFRRPKAWYPPAHGRIRPAFDVQGRPIDVPIIDDWGGSWLIGAASGSGKSGWMNAIVAQLVGQAPGTIGLLGVDLKRVELGPWAPAFHDVARDTAHADRMLAWVRDWIDRRMTALEAAGRRHVPDVPTLEWPHLALVIEELGAYLSGAKSDILDRRRAVLGEIAMLGRAAGLINVAAVQRPTTDLVPGQYRDNIGRRVLLRVSNLDQAKATLGWMPTQDEIDQLNIVGLGLVDLPGRDPFLARSCWGEINDVTTIIRRHTQEYAA